MLGGVITPLWCLELPVRQLRNGFSNSTQNLDLKTIFKPFGLDGWLKVSFLDYLIHTIILIKATHTVYLSTCSSFYIINQKPVIPKTDFYCITTLLFNNKQIMTSLEGNRQIYLPREIQNRLPKSFY